MYIKTATVAALVLLSLVPFTVGAKEKKQLERGMLESMDAVPCGAKERGVTGLGTVWASMGVTRVNSEEKLCPQYLLRSDEMDYQIRPTATKNPTLLPVGKEGEFKVKNNRIFLTVDRKTRTYQVVGMKPANTDSARDQNTSSTSSDKP